MLASLFQKSYLKPNWKFSVNGIIWRIIYTDLNFLVGEDRDIEKKKVTFFCLNLENGNLLWKNLSVLDDWWVGIEKIIDDKIIFHGFKKPDMPEHKKIIVADLGTGKIIWQNDDYPFYSANKNFIYAYRDLFERRIYYKLNSSNGEIVEEIDDLNDEILQSSFNKSNSNLIYPEPISFLDDAEYLKIVEGIIPKENLVGEIEFVILNENAIFSFHKKNKTNLQNIIIVINRKGEILHEEILTDETEYPTPDTFFVNYKTLFYIKNRNTIVALPILNKGSN
ncbi:MAG: DUF4905 domain-containing protein [Bacteroidota bacterium]